VAELDGVLYKEIVEQGLREFPNECCGLIAAVDGVPTKGFPMKNADASPATYRLDGTEQLRVFDQMEQSGLDLWAIYHSHTHSEAYPSPTDIQRAHYPDGSPTYPGIRYLLLSLEERANPVLRSFLFVEGEVTEEELTIT
jgi:proteasome lid subunit RPN8/RPN11